MDDRKRGGDRGTPVADAQAWDDVGVWCKTKNKRKKVETTEWINLVDSGTRPEPAGT